MYLEHPLSALLHLHLHSRLNTQLQWIGQRQLQNETRNIYVLGFGATCIRDFTVYYFLSNLFDISFIHSRIHSRLWEKNLGSLTWNAFFHCNKSKLHSTLLTLLKQPGQDGLWDPLSKHTPTLYNYPTGAYWGANSLLYEALISMGSERLQYLQCITKEDTTGLH